MAQIERADMRSEHASGNGASIPASAHLTLINRSYGNTLVRIGGHYFPRRTLVLALSETALLTASLLVATLVRFPNLSNAYAFLADHYNWYRFFFVTVICQLAFYYNDLYDLRRAT